MLKQLFGFDPAQNKLKTEIAAGITTFLTMAYILAVNPNIFSSLASQGMDTHAVFTATVLAAVVGTLIMAIYAKKPFGLAPGMGLNAFFVFTVCLTMGYPWQMALTAVLIEGFIFIILSATGIRSLMVDAIPASLKRAIGAGIGLFIAFIGLKNAGIVAANAATLVTIGKITEGSALLGAIGIVITSVLVIKKVPGSLLIGIIATTLIGIPMGITKITGLIDIPPSITPIFCQFDFSRIFSIDMVIIVLTFLFIDMFDTMGTVIGVSHKTGDVDEKGNIPNVEKIFLADAIGTVAGACFGTSTTTTYVESSAGVAEGGRTGLTAFTVALCFVLALFFSPLFLAIPSAATAPALILVGVMMMAPVKNLDWTDFTESIPAFITMLMMPVAYSISDGILLGVIAYVLVNACSGKFKKISPAMWVLAVLFILKYIFI